MIKSAGEPATDITAVVPDAVAMEVYADGGRRLYGRDGFSVAVEPTIHPVTDEALAMIDRGVPRPAVVPRPARDPKRIPRSQEPTPATGGRRRTGGTERSSMATAWRWIWGTFVFGLTAILLLTAIVSTVDLGNPESDIETGTVVVLWFMAALGVGACVRHVRR